MKVKGKVFLVTGGANGMGRELVLNLTKKGAMVVAVDINQQGLEETKEMAGAQAPNIETVVVDITNREIIANKKDHIINRFGHLDGIRNNAGIIQKFCHIKDMPFKDVERVMNINFYGTYNMLNAFLPYLCTRDEAHIVNVCSMGAFLPVPGQSLYGASKAAVRALTEGLMSELKGTNVHVSEVFPGAIKTDIKKNSGLKEDEETEENTNMKPILPSEAAEIIVNGIERNKKKIIVGKDCWIMDKLCRINVFTAMNLINKAMKGRHGM